MTTYSYEFYPDNIFKNPLVGSNLSINLEGKENQLKLVGLKV